MTGVVVKAYRYKGRKHLGPDGRVWKVVDVAMLDGKVHVKLRRAWRPLSRRFRYAEARGDGSIKWVNEGAELVAARIERGRR